MHCILFKTLYKNPIFKRMDGRQGRPMITYGTPLKEASSDTLSRWIKGEL